MKQRLLLLLCLAGCRTPTADLPPNLDRQPARAPVNEAILVSGRRVPVGTRVLLFTEPGGYDAASTEPHFDETDRVTAPTGLRFRSGRNHAAKESVFGQTFDEVLELVDLVVLHYDACGTSERCFEVLHDIRGLSAHFLIDLDGAIYQTLDLADTAWHAGPANARSIGIEIAHVGAHPPDAPGPLATWYEAGPTGTRLVLPSDASVHDAGFQGRPARDELVRGVIQGQDLVQYDFTDEQYKALAKLSVALVRTFPNVELRAPEDAYGQLLDRALTQSETDEFRGFCGHWHVSAAKVDPGPAFDWERFFGMVRVGLEWDEAAQRERAAAR